MALANATKQNKFLAPVGQAKKQITALGEDVAVALPHAEPVKADALALLAKLKLLVRISSVGEAEIQSAHHPNLIQRIAILSLHSPGSKNEETVQNQDQVVRISFCRLRPPPLSFAVHFSLVRRRADFDGASPNGRMLRHQLDGVVQVPGFEDEEAGQLLFGLRVGTISDRDFSALKPQRSGGLSALEPFSPNDVPVFPKQLVVGEELFHGGFPFAFGHCFPIYRTQV
jgi:hypothetical protein